MSEPKVNPNVGAVYSSDAVYLMHNISGKILPYHKEYEKMAKDGEMTKVKYREGRFVTFATPDVTEPVKVSTLAKKPIPKKPVISPAPDVPVDVEMIDLGNVVPVNDIDDMINNLNMDMKAT